MNKIAAFFTLVLCAQLTVSAQNEDDALRYSFLTFGGTARSMGLGGAFGALGADFSTLSMNPAGIGLYSSSEFTFSPSMYVGKTSTQYTGASYDDMRYNFNLGNIGMVLAYPSKKASTTPGWRAVQFGFGINRTNNFNTRMVVEGENHNSSMLDTWVQYADGQTPDNLSPFDVGLGFDAWLLDTLSGSNTKYKNAAPGGGVLQRRSLNTSGSMNEWVLTLGANYDDRLYFGATLGFPFLRYHEENTYNEKALADVVGFDEFREFTYHQNLDVNGSGFNFKFGFIFKPVDFVRIGASIHTPTYFYNMHENYTSSVKSKFDNGDTYKEDSPEGKYDYKLNTPMRATGSIAFIIGQYGLVSADYEFIDYSESRFRSDEAEAYFDVNDAIRNKYTTATNLRLGTEWRLNQFLVRGGYAMYDSPFKSNINDAARSSYTFGLGMRESNYSLDFAYIYSTSQQDYYLYDASLAPLTAAKNENISQNFIMTLGFRF